MLTQFERYLEEKGHSTTTPSGLRSTTYDYANVRIPTICKREEISLEEVAYNISFYVNKYDSLGSEADFGNKSHRAFISALKRFEEFSKWKKTSNVHQ